MLAFGVWIFAGWSSASGKDEPGARERSTQGASSERSATAKEDRASKPAASSTDAAEARTPAITLGAEDRAAASRDKSNSSSAGTPGPLLEQPNSNPERHTVRRLDTDEAQDQHQGTSRTGKNRYSADERESQDAISSPPDREQDQASGQRGKYSHEKDATERTRSSQRSYRSGQHAEGDQKHPYGARQSSHEEADENAPRQHDDERDWQHSKQRQSAGQRFPHRERSDADRDETHEQGRHDASKSAEHAGGQRGARGKFGLDFSSDNDRLTVSRVTRGSHASRAGFEQGDRILSVDNRRISSQSDFNRWMRTARAGTAVAIVVLRDGQRETVYWTAPSAEYGETEYAEQRSSDERDQSRYAAEFTGEGRGYLGVQLDGRYPNAAVVTEVIPESPADRAGLSPGDMILRLNGQPVRSSSDLTEQVQQMEPGTPVHIQFSRRQLQDAQVRLGRRDAQVDQAGYQDSEGARPSRSEASEDTSYSEGSAQQRSVREDADANWNRRPAERRQYRGTRGRFFER